MKKVIGFFLILSVVFTNTAVFVSAASPAGNASSLYDCEKELTVFQKLGIIAEADNVDLDGSVTRGEFTALIATVLHAEPVLRKNYYLDVTAENRYYGSINAMREYGLIDASDDNKFYPDDSITFEQACKLLVIAMGYKSQALAIGGGLSGYVKMAQRKDITVDVEDYNSINHREMFRMLYKAMSESSAELVGISDDEYIVNDKNGSTLFELYYNTYIEERRLESLYDSSMNSEVTEAENIAVFDGQEFIVDESNAYAPHLCELMEIVYTDNKDESYTVIYASQSAKSESITIESKDIKNFDADAIEIEYFRDINSNRVLKQKISNSAQIVFNGLPIQGKLSDKINAFINKERKGTIKLVKENSGVDYVVIKSYETFIASGYDTANKIIYNEYDKTRRILMNEFVNVSVKDYLLYEVDVPTSFPTALSIAESDTKGQLEIIVNTNQRQVTVSDVYPEEGRIIAGGEELYIDDSVMQNIMPNIQAGKTIVIAVDMFGDIVKADVSALFGMQIGYLRKAILTDDSFRKEIVFNLYMDDKKFHTFKLAEKLTLDGDSYKTDNYMSVLNNFPGFSGVSSNGKIDIERQVILFELNENGEMKKIDTYKVGKNESTEKTLTRTLDGTKKALYRGSQNRFGLNDVYDVSKTKLFAVPISDKNGNIQVGNTIQSDDDARWYDTQMVLKWDEEYTPECYYYDNTSFYVDIMVIRYEPTVESEMVVMFEEMTEVLNSDDEVVKNIKGVGSNGEVNFIVDEGCMEQALALNPGDLFTVTTHSNGTYVSKITKQFDEKTRRFIHDTTNDYWLDGIYDPMGGWNWRSPIIQMTRGYAYDTMENWIKITYEIPDAANGISNETMPTNNIPVVVLDKEAKDTVTIGRATDAETYKQVGSACNMVVTHVCKGDLRSIYIYK